MNTIVLFPHKPIEMCNIKKLKMLGACDGWEINTMHENERSSIGIIYTKKNLCTAKWMNTRSV